jgi:hypothetical protein
MPLGFITVPNTAPLIYFFININLNEIILPQNIFMAVLNIAKYLSGIIPYFTKLFLWPNNLQNRKERKGIKGKHPLCT